MNYVLNDDDITISHSAAVNERAFSGIHFHNDYEIYYLIKGDTTYFIGDEIFYIRPGSFVFIPKGVLHKTDSEKCMNIERFLININSNVLDYEIKKILNEFCKDKVVYISKTDVKEFLELIDKIEREYAKDDLHRTGMIKLYISELLIMISRKKNVYKPKLSETEKIMQNVAEYIGMNFAEDITLNFLAAKFAMSESYLSRKFKTVCGIGICEYITNVRITNAKKFLREESVSISNVAFRCGFNDSNYFSSVFKKLIGTSPLEYSKKYNLT